MSGNFHFLFWFTVRFTSNRLITPFLYLRAQHSRPEAKQSTPGHIEILRKLFHCCICPSTRVLPAWRLHSNIRYKSLIDRTPHFFSRQIPIEILSMFSPFTSFWPFDYLYKCQKESYSWTFLLTASKQLLLKTIRVWKFGLTTVNAGSKTFVWVLLCINKHAHKRLINHTILSVFTCVKKFDPSLVLRKGGQSCSVKKMMQFSSHNCNNKRGLRTFGWSM